MTQPAPRIVLGSSSPRRRDLLEQLGLDIVIRPADIDETERPGEDPVAYVHRLAS
jgi:septum formation protein